MGEVMKKLVEINSVCNGSTGNIMCNIAKEANKQNFETYCFFGRGNPNTEVKCKKFGNKLTFYFHTFIARLGFNGRGSYFATKKMVKELKKINPNVIHLHNIHGYYLNLKVLFKYLKKDYKGKVIWTLHDCWTFTGHCSHFTLAKCNKWKKSCSKCPQLNVYPKTLFDTSKKEYELKKKLFLGLNDLTLITPSIWLKKLVEKSFLKEYKVKVINNGIDLNIFKPTYDEAIYEKYNIPKEKKILLGISSVWGERKGLNDINKLHDIIDNKYQIIIVGKILEKQKKDGIIYIERTDNLKELAKIYTIADYLINFTYEDNYPTVNLEAIACHTPVITYNTGGCPEQVNDETGVVFKKNQIKEIASFLNKKIKLEINNNNNVNSTLDMINDYIRIIKQ